MAGSQSGYRWVSEDEAWQEGCLTAVTGSTREQVLAAFGADPGRAPVLWRDWEDAYYDADGEYTADPDRVAVTVAAVPGGWLVVEVAGYQGTRPEVLARASAGGRAASTSWNENADMTIAVAEGGQVLCTFDPAAPVSRFGTDTPVMAALLEGVSLHPDDGWVQAGLVVAERFTGVPTPQEPVLGWPRQVYLGQAWPQEDIALPAGEPGEAIDYPDLGEDDGEPFDPDPPGPGSAFDVPTPPPRHPRS